MTPSKLLWKSLAIGLAVSGVGAALTSVFPTPGPDWGEDMFDVFGDDDDEL
jgi:hypothetical protein